MFNFLKKPEPIEDKKYEVRFYNYNGDCIYECVLDQHTIDRIELMVTGGLPYWIHPEQGEMFLIGNHITRITYRPMRRKPGPKPKVQE
jgi:hypothetical protein